MYYRPSDTPPWSRLRRWAYVATLVILWTVVWGTVGLSFGCDPDDSTGLDIVEETHIPSSATTTSYNEAIRAGTKKLLNLSDYQGAIKDFDEAIRLEPQNAVAYFNRGTAYLYLGLADLASEKLEHALEAFVEVLANYDQAISLDPEYADAYGSRGAAYVYLEKYELAIQDYTEAIRIEPLAANAYEGRGYAYAYLEKYERAIEDYTEAIRIEPLAAELYAARAALYDALVDPQRSIQDRETACELDKQYCD